MHNTDGAAYNHDGPDTHAVDAPPGLHGVHGPHVLHDPRIFHTRSHGYDIRKDDTGGKRRNHDYICIHSCNGVLVCDVAVRAFHVLYALHRLHDLCNGAADDKHIHIGFHY